MCKHCCRLWGDSREPKDKTLCSPGTHGLMGREARNQTSKENM